MQTSQTNRRWNGVRTAEPPRPAEYNVLRPLNATEWVRTNKWITNRALFLLELRSRKPNVFDGGIYEEMDVDTIMALYRASYVREWHQLSAQYPRHAAHAEIIHLATDPFGAIPYVR